MARHVKFVAIGRMEDASLLSYCDFWNKDSDERFAEHASAVLSSRGFSAVIGQGRSRLQLENEPTTYYLEVDSEVPGRVYVVATTSKYPRRNVFSGIIRGKCSCSTALGPWSKLMKVAPLQK